MNRHTTRLLIPAAAALLTFTAIAAERESLTPRREDGPGLSLRVNDESAPAGSIVQIKIDVTEPKPISTGRGKIKSTAIAAVEGIVLMNEGQDTYGVAMLDGDELSFAITSPSATFGTPADYPILGIAGRVHNASNGTGFDVTLDANGLGFRDPSGILYPTEIKNGRLTIDSGAIAIGDVTPGSSIVPAGGVVQIHGRNFTPATRLQLSESAVAEQRFLSSERIDVVLAQTTNMHGLRIRARNDDKSGLPKSESEYFSYERTSALGASNDPILSKTVPLFAPATYTDATIELPPPSARRTRAVRRLSSEASSNLKFGIALQNLGSTTANVEIELRNAAGHPFAVNHVSIGTDRHFVRELEEIFGIAARPASIRVRSDVPIHLLGLTADPSTGSAAALPPH